MKLDWRYRLRGDPAPWLLDYEDNPSVHFWFQRDIVGRPEDAAALVEARERILFSAPVQDFFAAQDGHGFWDNPDSLDEPYRRATLWVLAQLAELGVPRTSRRARTACEFILQNHLSVDGTFRLADASLTGLVLRTLFYFNCHDDARLIKPISLVTQDAARGNPFALWALADWASVASKPAIERGVESVLIALERGAYTKFGVFPSFDARDALLALRVLAQLNRAKDSRSHLTIEQIWARQGPGGRWSGDGMAEPDKWTTLNVLRIVTKL